MLTRREPCPCGRRIPLKTRDPTSSSSERLSRGNIYTSFAEDFEYLLVLTRQAFADQFECIVDRFVFVIAPRGLLRSTAFISRIGSLLRRVVLLVDRTRL